MLKCKILHFTPKQECVQDLFYKKPVSLLLWSLWLASFTVTWPALVAMETYTDEIFVFVFAAEYRGGGRGGQVYPTTPRVPVSILTNSV